MQKRVIVISLALLVLIWGTTFTGEEEQLKISFLDKSVVLAPPPLSSSRAACSIQKHDDTVFGFFSGFETGDRIVTYFDLAAECGSPTYPFEIQSISLTLLDNGGYQWPVDIDVFVIDPVGADSCGGPGVELCRFTVTCDSSTYALPSVGTVTFPTVCCINGPVFIGIEYSDNGAGLFPSITFDKSAPVPSCENWGFGIEGWSEWYDFWTGPNFPGYPIFWVDGETQSSACGPRVVINEVKPYPTSNVQDGNQYNYAFVELHNAGSSLQSIDSWELRAANGASLAVLPSVSLQPGDFMIFSFGVGTDDLDLSDGSGTYYTNGDSSVFDASADGAALYDGTGGAALMIDATFWSRESTAPTGTAYSDAISAGIWSGGDYFDIDSAYQFSTYGLCPDGVDHNSSSDWREFGWGEYGIAWAGPENPLQISPANGGLLDEYSEVLTWGSISFADSFLVEVDVDTFFASPGLLTITTDTTASASGLSTGLYYWRVRVFESGLLLGPYVSFQFVKDATAKSGADPQLSVQLGVSRLIQHKDTRILCIYEHPPGHRPGCAEVAGANGPWDASHATSTAHVPNCEHCTWYCSRAVIAMVNNYYSGDLSQDRISYELFFANNPGPEADLGHNQGTWLGASGGTHGTGRRWQIYEWALGTTVTRHTGKPPFDTIKAHIDAGRPIYIDGQNHATLVYGYYYQDPMGANPVPAVYIHNPWPGTAGFSTYSAWQPDNSGWGSGGYFVIPSGYDGSSAIDQEASVTNDADGDGVMDFDEQAVRNFHSVMNDTDTEDDQVMDKAEIRNYTFHDRTGYHVGHENNALNFPDVDMDGLRAENDCDSDNDSDFDGGEDINGNGNNPVPNAGHVCTRETCQFDNSEFCISVAVDKDTYLLGEPVYIVDYHFSRQTHTYHANSTYNYEKGPLCPTKADGSALGHNGSFTTDAGGHARQTLVEYCLSPGVKYLTVDVLDDNLYSTPDNLDPQTCWECQGDWFHGFHWPYDYPDHNPSLTYPTYDYPVYCINEPNPTLITYSIECPWWWWCYVWPPVTDRYWLAIEVDQALLDNNIITITQPPTIVQGSEFCSQPPLQFFDFDEALTLDLQATSTNPDKQWLAFSTNQWQLPDSLISTRLTLDIPIGTKFAATPYVKIMAGDSVFGWSPTPYDSIPISVITSCCIGNRGDVNGDGNDANILDLNWLVNYIFRSGAPAPCPEEADLNSDGNSANILDLTRIVNYIFRGGAAPGPC